jgi:hypothetical protein
VPLPVIHEEEHTEEDRDLTIGFPTALANLIVTEQSHITIRSDTRRDPTSASYDLRIPPATYNEAMKRPDSEQWRAAMQKEINLMSEMNVYKIVPLPPGRKPIGNRWVLEL